MVRLFAERDYDEAKIREDCPFLVQDVLFNALLCQAEKDLAQIARVLGADPSPFEQRAQEMVRAMNEKLWDEGHSTYLDFDLAAGRPIRAFTAPNIAGSLYAGIPDEGRARRMVGALESNFCLKGDGGKPVPSYDRYGFGFSPVKYFEQDVENYLRLGVDAIEVCEFKLDEDRAADQLAFVGQQDLTISSVQPEIRTLFPSRTQPEPKDLRERTSRFRGTIERVGRFATGIPFVTNTGPPPNGNVRAVVDVATREYRALADFAQAHGARIALEPLSPAIMNVESAIWTLEQAMRIVAAVDRIFVVQVSDWRTPRSFDDRRIIGRGEIPLQTLLCALHESGYRGAYVLEIFSGDVPDSLWEADLSEVIRDSRIGLEEAWREAVGPS